MWLVVGRPDGCCTGRELLYESGCQKAPFIMLICLSLFWLYFFIIHLGVLIRSFVNISFGFPLGFS